MWNFAVGIYFISLNPTNLQGVALNGIVLNLVVILFGPNIGDWIDRNPRLTSKNFHFDRFDQNVFRSALRKSLYIQNLSVALMAILVLIALLYQSTLPSYSMFIIQGENLFCFLFVSMNFWTNASLFSKVFSLESVRSLLSPVFRPKFVFREIGSSLFTDPIEKI